MHSGFFLQGNQVGGVTAGNQGGGVLTGNLRAGLPGGNQGAVGQVCSIMITVVCGFWFIQDFLTRWVICQEDWVVFSWVRGAMAWAWLGTLLEAWVGRMIGQEEGVLGGSKGELEFSGG